MSISDDEVSLYMKDLSQDTNVPNSFEDFELDGEKIHQPNSSEDPGEGLQLHVLADVSMDLVALVNEYSKTNNNHCLSDISQNLVRLTDHIDDISDIQIIHNDFTGDELDGNLDYNLFEEIIITHDEVNEVEKQTNYEINGTMTVKEQPKSDQRGRYASDGPRFLPDSKKHPMSIQLPDLSSVLLADNEIFGIILTMVTSTNNLKNKTFVHVNGIKYRTGDAIELENGSIFLPLTKSDIQTGEKIFPRLSIICKKVDEYTFDLTSFDTTTCERIMEKYTIINEDKTTKAAKGKQFTTDYDLHSYKFVFQLALKQDDIFKIFLNVKCETNIINEQKTSPKEIKQKASTSDDISRKRKNNNNMPMLNSSKKFKSTTTEYPKQKKGV
ncbi:unnamed protein product [Adineta steineri]|uniref:Uncharacterized protein n=1 Tax=Adineta steineri TaxID=433720 RepID=A0A815I088_9BILA|nr:unnamed protein product [Adineta steineri]CAF3598656.1 unnamed protein product [Adineta steineri]